MTDLDQRISTLEELLRPLTQKKPSTLWRCWNWIKPYIVPFLMGMLLGMIVPLPFVTFERPAAQGGAALAPFSESIPPSEPRLPSPSSLLPTNLNAEKIDSSLTSICEQPSLDSPAADVGQTTSTRFYRRPLRRMR